MSTTVSETVNTTDNSEDNVSNTATENATPAFDLSVLDETDSFMFNKTQKAIAEYNETLNTLKRLSGDENEVTESIAQSDDPEIVSLREAVEKAQAALKSRQEKLDSVAREKAKAQIAENTDTEKVESLKVTSEKLLKRIKATQKALAVDYGDAIVSAFTSLVTSRGSSGSATGRGAGVPRPRNFTVKVDGETAVLPNNNGEKVSSFSAAAKVLGVPTTEIQQGYFAKMGTDAEGWIPGKSVTFEVKGADGKTHKVEATKNKD